jgi:serine protease Do
MRFRLFALSGVVLSAGLVFAEPATKAIPAPPPAVTKALPESIDDLKAVQKQVREVIDKVIPCTVCLQVGGASGSGVIVSEDGLILTAGHVSGDPGRKITVILHDGRRVNGITLGRWSLIDSGMAQITSDGTWPYAELGNSKDLKAGQWCIATGHPGGIKRDRPPVVRVGRIGFRDDTMVQSDCTLVGGDSGGPLFDMTGKVIGIHSRIGNPLTANIHVPVDTYRDTWDQLVKSEKIGETPVWLGVKADIDAKNCKLGEITKDSPAEKAGLKAGDVITRFAGKDVTSYQDMVKLLQKQKPGDEVALELKRGDETKELRLTLGKRKD